MSEFAAIDLVRKFGTIAAVSHVNLSLRPGELVGLLGPNGAGKSTTMKMLAGLMVPTSGRIVYGDLSMHQNPIDIKRYLGYLADEPMMIPQLTGWEYIHFVGGLYSLNADDISQRADPLVRRFQLQDAIHRRCITYSHGMQQKLALVAQLVHDPHILLADEPTVGLDPASATIMQEVFREHCMSGHSILLSTHLLDMAEKLCHRILIMRDGSIIWDGSPEALRQSNRSLEEVFLELTGLST